MKPSTYIFILVCLSNLLTSNVFSQSNNPFSANTYKQWHTGGGGGIVFNDAGVSTFEELGIASNIPAYGIESCATYCDPITGDVLMYSDGMIAWRADGSVIPTSSGASIYNTVSGFAHGTAGSPLIIAPPGQCGSLDSLYIFFTDDESRQEGDSTGEAGTYRNPELYYVVVDLETNVISEPVQFTNYHTSEQINAVQVSSDSIWLVYRADGSDSTSKGNSIYAHLWTTNEGLSTSSVITPNIYIGNDYRYRSAFSLDGNKFAATSAWSSWGENEHILLCDFNQQTGMFNNPIYLYDENSQNAFSSYGIAFSPDHSKLYVTISQEIIQFDITSNDQSQIQNSQINISNGGNYGGLQNGPDGKIYASNGFWGGGLSNTISVIHEPNLSGNACNFELNVLSTGIRTTSGLQNIVYGAEITACLTPTDDLLVNVTVQNASCGSPDGFIESTVSGGLPPYNYSWSNAATTPNIYDLNAGNYSLLVSDAAGQSVSLDNIVVTGGNTPIYTYLDPIGVCYCQSITVGGEAYDCEDEGENSITLSSEQGCDSIVVFVLEVYDIVASVSVSNISCGEGTGTVTVQASGGFGDYAYQWNDGATGAIRTGLTFGTYNLTITDDLNCNYIETIDFSYSENRDTLYETICEGDSYLIGDDNYSEEGEYSDTIFDVDNCPIIYVLYLDVLEWNTTGIIKTDASCGQNNGSITANPSSESGGFYQYNWNTGANTPTIQNLDAGIYILTITDNAGCTIVDSVEINFSALAPAYVSASICNGACYEVADTTICDSGTHTIITTNAAGTCDSIIYLDLTIANSGLEVVLNALQTNFFCMQDEDGSISSMTTGGTEPYQYSWTNELGIQVGNTANLNAVPAGEYTLQVTDAYDCTATTSLSLLSSSLETFLVTASICEGDTYELDGNLISQPGTYTSGTMLSYYGCDSLVVLTLSTDGIVFSANVNDATCGENDGSIDIAISNQSNYSFLWNTGNFEADIFGLSAGVYELTITDSENGCISTASYQLENLPVDTTYLSIEFCPDSCYWVSNVSLCSPGIHEVLLETEAASCDSLVIVNLSLEPALSLVLNSVNENCGMGDGFIESNVSGGIPPYAYTWTDENGTVLSVDPALQNIGAGIYTLEVRDSLGCTVTRDTMLESTDFNYIYIDTTLCQGDSFELNGDFISSSGTYEVTMINQYGCDSTVHLALDFNSFTFDIDFTNADCGINNGIASIVISPAVNYQYNWSTNSILPIIENLAPATYHVTVTNDSNGCEQMDSVVIDYSAVDTSFVAVICPDSCYVIGDSIFCEEGQYNVLLETIEYGCDSIIDLIVLVGLPLSISFDSTQTEYYCMQSEGEIFTTVSGGFSPYSYLWTDANGDVVDSTSNPTGLSEGTYTVQVTDSIGCVLMDSITLHSLNFFTFVVDTMICAGECYELDSVFYCEDNTQVVDTLQSFYGCDSIVELWLRVYEINFELDTVDSSCGEDNGIATVMNPYSNSNVYSNPFNIVWTNSSWNSSRQGTSIDSLSPGMYYVTLRNLDAYNDMGCASMDSFEIDYLPFDSTFVEICEGDCFEIDSVLYCDIYPGYYRDTIEGFNGCDSIVELRIIKDIDVSASISMTDIENTCHSSVYVTGYLPVSNDVEIIGHWSSPDPNIEFDDSLSTEVWAHHLKEGENIFYWNLTKGACSRVDTAIVFYEGEPIAVDDYFELSYQSDTILNLTANDDLYNTPTSVRLFVDNDSTIVLNDSLVNFKAPRGFFGIIEFEYLLCNSFCSDFCDTATVRIKVLPYDTDSPFPDIITPNGDGLNDTWVVDPLLINPQDYPDCELFVFNRWGDRVYHSKPYNNDWAGENQKNGAPLPESTYYYILYLDIGKGEVYNGQILLNR